MTAPIIPAMERVAELLEAAARELRNLSGSSTGDLDPLRGDEAQCDVPGPEPVAPPLMTPPTSTEPSPVTTTEAPMLLTRAELAQLLRLHPRTISRLRADPEVGFPEPVRLGGAVRWRRSSVMRWIAARAG